MSWGLFILVKQSETLPVELMNQHMPFDDLLLSNTSCHDHRLHRDAESTVHKSWCNLHPMLTGYTQWCFLAVFLFTDGFLDGFFSTLPFPRPIAEVEVDPFPLPLPSMSLRSWHDALSTFDPCTTLRVAKSQVVYLPDAASSVLMAS